MDWIRERRGSTGWKGSWKDQTLASISPPPFPLLTLLFITFLLLYLSYSHPNNHQGLTNFKLFLFFLPLLVLFLAQLLSKFERFASPQTNPEYYAGAAAQPRRWDFPWGLVVAVAFLLLLAAFHPSF